MKRAADGALNVREINLGDTLGKTTDTVEDQTVIGLLKSITFMLQ